MCGGMTAAIAVLVALSPVGAGLVAADGLAVEDSYSVAEDGVLTVPVETGVLANDTGGSLMLCVSSFDTTGLQGSLTDPPGVASDGSFTYTPSPNFNGVTTFTYQVATSAGGACPEVSEGTAMVTITVTPVNDPPSAASDSFTALGNRTLNVAAPGVLGNDTDIDGDPLTAVKTSSPSHGTVSLAADGGFSYTPDAGYVGPDAFSYRANDGAANSPQRVVSLTIVAVPPTPSPTPVPTPTPPPPTATPASSPSESALPSGSDIPSTSPGAVSFPPSASPSPGPASGPSSDEGGPPILAIAALLLLLGLLAAAAVYFVRSQRGDDGEAYESVWPAAESEGLDAVDDEDDPRA